MWQVWTNAADFGPVTRPVRNYQIILSLSVMLVIFFPDTPVATGDFKWEGLRKYLDHSIFQNVDRKKALSIEMLFKDLLVKASTIIEDNDGGRYTYLDLTRIIVSDQPK